MPLSFTLLVCLAILFAFGVLKNTQSALRCKCLYTALACALFALAVIAPSLYPARGIIIKPWAILLCAACLCFLRRGFNRSFVLCALICTVILTVSAMTAGNVYLTALALCLAAVTAGSIKTALFAVFAAWVAGEVLAALLFLPYIEIGIGDIPDACTLALALCLALFEAVYAIKRKTP